MSSFQDKLDEIFVKLRQSNVYGDGKFSEREAKAAIIALVDSDVIGPFDTADNDVLPHWAASRNSLRSDQRQILHGGENA